MRRCNLRAFGLLLPLILTAVASVFRILLAVRVDRIWGWVIASIGLEVVSHIILLVQALKGVDVGMMFIAFIFGMLSHIPTLLVDRLEVFTDHRGERNALLLGIGISLHLFLNIPIGEMFWEMIKMDGDIADGKPIDDRTVEYTVSTERDPQCGICGRSMGNSSYRFRPDPEENNNPTYIAAHYGCLIDTNLDTHPRLVRTHGLRAFIHLIVAAMAIQIHLSVLANHVDFPSAYCLFGLLAAIPIITLLFSWSTGKPTLPDPSGENNQEEPEYPEKLCVPCRTPKSRLWWTRTFLGWFPLPFFFIFFFGIIRLWLTNTGYSFWMVFIIPSGFIPFGLWLGWSILVGTIWVIYATLKCCTQVVIPMACESCANTFCPRTEV